MYNLLTVLGHTAGGKTRFAACLADRIGGEIIGADSRQVYRRMNLGSGKDYSDYEVLGRKVPYHLIDIVEPGYQYNVYEYQKDFYRVFSQIRGRKKMPVLCGGSGLYIEAVLKGYRLIRVPVNRTLRENLKNKSIEDLSAMLASFKNPHNVTDTGNLKRLLRALEIEMYYRDHPEFQNEIPNLEPLLLGIRYDRISRRKRISLRLHERLREGMIEEVRDLLAEGVAPEKLIYYGLEYRFITEYLLGKTSLEEMTTKLETAIHQFAKRQMTWFRRMERNGAKIHWLDGQLSLEEKLDLSLSLLET